MAGRFAINGFWPHSARNVLLRAIASPAARISEVVPDQRLGPVEPTSFVARRFRARPFPAPSRSRAIRSASATAQDQGFADCAIPSKLQWKEPASTSRWT